MNSVPDIKFSIIDMLEKRGNGLTFAELAKIPGFSGELHLEIEGKNIIFWLHCSPEAVDAVKQLLSEKKIELLETHPMTYEADGFLSPLPLAQSWERAYSSPRFAPAQIVKGVAFA